MIDLIFDGIAGLGLAAIVVSIAFALWSLLSRGRDDFDPV
jgi:hypothetical protein